MTSNEETESDAKPDSREQAEAEKEARKEVEKEIEKLEEGAEGEEEEKEEEEEEEKHDTPALPVLYKVQYLDTDDDIVFSKESREPIGAQGMLSTLGKSVIEVITNVRVIDSYGKKNAKKEPPAPIKILDTELKINSPAIINALQHVIEYYPGVSFSENSFSIPEPYAALIHHEEELKVYRAQFHPDAVNSNDELCQRNVNAYEHLGILQNIVFQLSGKAVEAERQRHARGVATFEMLWLLFRPGTDIYWYKRFDGTCDALVVESVSVGMSEGRPTPLKVSAWDMTYDGDKIGRCKWTILQSVYDGEKEISSLNLFPCKFWKEESKEAVPLKLKLEERGKMFFKLTQKRCMDYNGTTYRWPRKHVCIS